MANSPAPALVLHEGEEDLLEEWVRSSTIKAGLAKRARIVLLAADGLANTRIAELTGASASLIGAPSAHPTNVTDRGMAQGTENAARARPR